MHFCLLTIWVNEKRKKRLVRKRENQPKYREPNRYVGSKNHPVHNLCTRLYRAECVSSRQAPRVSYATLLHRSWRNVWAFSLATKTIIRTDTKRLFSRTRYLCNLENALRPPCRLYLHTPSHESNVARLSFGYRSHDYTTNTTMHTKSPTKIQNPCMTHTAYSGVPCS